MWPRSPELATLYRLSAATYPGTGNSEAFTYDAAGNRLAHTQGAAIHAYEYWPNSNRLKAIHTTNLAGAIEKSFTYDDEGRMITQAGTGAKTLSWDQKSRAKTISANARTVSYQYDPLDYRIGSYGAIFNLHHVFACREIGRIQYIGLMRRSWTRNQTS